MRSTIIDGDTIFVQEGIGDKMYSYQMVHSDVVIAEINAYKNQRDKGETEGPSILDTEEMTDMSWVRKLRGVKYGCEVSELDDPLDTKNVVLQEEHEDGTSTWIVDNKWSVDVSSELIPWQLAAIDGGGAIEIHGVDTCPGMQIKGCNPETEGGAPAYTGPDERRLTEMVNTAISELSEDNDYDAQKGSIRKLDALSDFQHFGSQTNWCGTGSVAGNAACPGTGSVVTSPLYNYQADRACRRHDHGAYVEVFGGVIPRLECNVDRDLVGSCGGHPVVHAVFGDWGASQFWGW